jgi:feruloyl esterase
MVSVKFSAAVMHRNVKVAGVASAVATLMACTTVQTAAPPMLKPATGASLATCTTLASTLKLDNTRIDSVADVAVGALKLGEQSVVAHCLVKGRLAERKGVDGRDYAIGFEMRLPLSWNGRFYYQGNGGLDGAVLPAQGALGGGPITGALMQGFAVISSDAGHTGAQTTVFGSEPQARLDYGYQAVEKLTPMAKQLITQAYG